VLALNSSARSGSRRRRWARWALAAVACGGLAAACSGADNSQTPFYSSIDDEFTRRAQSFLCTEGQDNILSDKAFTDSKTITAQQVQNFLSKTPYGKSCLAGYNEGTGANKQTAAQMIVSSAQKAGINPLVLIVRLQVEQSLIAAKTCSASKLDRAFGCRCPDNGPCDPAYASFSKQLDCAGERFSTYYKSLQNGGSTVSGWQVGKPHKTSDSPPYTVVPANAATAAMYTYTPWVLPDAGGNYNNWFFFRRFAKALGYTDPSNASNLTFPEIKPPTKKNQPCSGYAKPPATKTKDAGKDAKSDAGDAGSDAASDAASDAGQKLTCGQYAAKHDWPSFSCTTCNGQGVQTKDCTTCCSQCVHDTDCPDGEVCATNGDSYCCRSPGPSGTLCEANNECPGGQVCAWNGQHYYCMAPACN
jgi:Dickkopf N-terminal cysteine-rich region